ncbi:unnamed protein product, partial [marine sediment metagenome]
MQRKTRSLFEGFCPDCDGLLEMREFKDGGEDGDINHDWWCPDCKLRWLSMDGPPMEANVVAPLDDLMKQFDDI